MATPPEILWMRVKEEPLVFIFLGLTCAALGGGLRTLANGDKRQSQLMMRARVFFQLCTVTTLAGTVYWKAYTGEACALLFPRHKLGAFSPSRTSFSYPGTFSTSCRTDPTSLGDLPPPPSTFHTPYCSDGPEALSWSKAP